MIGRDGKPAPVGLAVIVWGLTEEAGGAPRALLTLQTQVGGYFAGPWPSDALVAAYGEVGGDRASISLVDGRMPQRAVLVLHLPATEDDCECAPTPPRHPDQQDLVANSQAFSQDLGGGCINLTMPNRVLEEYSYFTVLRTTEPDVRPMNTEPPGRVPPRVLRKLTALTADAGVLVGTDTVVADDVQPATPAGLFASLDTRRAKELLASPEAITAENLHTAVIKSEAIDLHRLIDLLGGQPTRNQLDGRHSIDWDASPTVYEATTVALGHVLHFRQVWRADGYSLGDLLYSLPLAPGQKRLVSMLDWTRRTSSERTEVLESEERMEAPPSATATSRRSSTVTSTSASTAGRGRPARRPAAGSARASLAPASACSPGSPAVRAGRARPPGRTPRAHSRATRCSSCETGPRSAPRRSAACARR